MWPFSSHGKTSRCVICGGLATQLVRSLDELFGICEVCSRAWDEHYARVLKPEMEAIDKARMEFMKGADTAHYARVRSQLDTVMRRAYGLSVVEKK